MENTAVKSYRDRLMEAALNGYLDGSVCPYCNQKTELIDSSEVYHGVSYGMMYICRKCNAYVGCYDNSTRALGRLADEELRMAKHRAHEHFDRLWKEKKHTKWHRGKAYRWLSRQLDIPFEYTHIGMFDKDMCERTIELADKYLKQEM